MTEFLRANFNIRSILAVLHIFLVSFAVRDLFGTLGFLIFGKLTSQPHYDALKGGAFMVMLLYSIPLSMGIIATLWAFMAKSRTFADRIVVVSVGLVGFWPFRFIQFFLENTY